MGVPQVLDKIQSGHQMVFAVMQWLLHGVVCTCTSVDEKEH